MTAVAQALLSLIGLALLIWGVGGYIETWKGGQS